MGRKFKAKKNPYEELGEEFTSSILSMNRDEIRERIAKIAIAQDELMEAKKKDEDLKQAQLEARNAGAVYTEGTKANKLKIKYCRMILDSKGGDVSGSEPPESPKQQPFRVTVIDSGA